MTRTFTTLALVLMSSSLATATVTEWSGRTAGTDYVIDGSGNVEILTSGTFKFQSEDGGNNLTDIGGITINSSVTGTVTVFIERDTDDNSPGAVNVDLLNLTNTSGVVGNLAELRITGDLGVTGPTVIRNLTGALSANDLVDAITIENNLTTAGSINVGAAGDITIRDGRLNGNITATSLGDVTLTAAVGLFPPQTGDITVNGNYAGVISSNKRFEGNISISGNLTGTIDLNFNLTGVIDIGGDLTAPGKIDVANIVGAAGSVPNVLIHIHGSLNGSQTTGPLIHVGLQLNDVIAIDGSFGNAVTGAGEVEIDINEFGSKGGFAVDYDGWDSGDDWVTDAEIRIGVIDYGTNTPAENLWHITECKGDMTNDGFLTSADTTPFNESAATYSTNRPGLAGSRDYHRDLDFDGDFDSIDTARYTSLVADECCITSEPASSCHPADLNKDFQINLSDLAVLLANFGTASGATHDDGDIEPTDGDGDVDLSDLAVMLSAFGELCSPCFPVPLPSGTLTVCVDAYDTGAFTGGGFAGEADHFVFDAFSDITTTDDDDWTTSGVLITAANGATFRLAPVDPNTGVPTPGASTEPEKYTTFFSVPKNVNGGARFTNPFPSGAIAGACQTGGTYTFTTTSIDACWYDVNATSKDNNGAVVRIVIDVSGVIGAVTTSGFGSVYYSTTGANHPSDIKVADFHFMTTHKAEEEVTTESSGAFWVKGT